MRLAFVIAALFSAAGLSAVNVHAIARPSRPHTLRGRTETRYCAPAAK